MSDEITKEKIDELLTHTKSLINHIYWFKQDFNIQPSKEHIGAAINFTDIQERKDDFLKELVNTVASWVYSKAKSKQILDDRLAIVDFDHGNASSFLTTQAFSKFRPGQPQGQFGELLLFNFIQYFFMAVPLLRKQRIITSVGHERYGADAIHFKKDGDKNIIIIGESKCYKSKYKFNAAFKTSLESIINSFDTFSEELQLYTYEDFIETELENIQYFRLHIVPSVHNFTQSQNTRKSPFYDQKNEKTQLSNPLIPKQTSQILIFPYIFTKLPLSNHDFYIKIKSLSTSC